MAGAPDKLTDEVHAVIVEAAREGNFLRTIAARARISSQTLRNWRKRGRRLVEDVPPEEWTQEDQRWIGFLRDLEAAEAEAEADLQTKIRNSEDWRAHSWLLARRWSQRWSQRAENLLQTEEEDVTEEEELLRDGETRALLDALAERVACLSARHSARVEPRSIPASASPSEPEPTS